MCRFLAYFGNEKSLLSDLLEKPSNSLIAQSRHAKICRHGFSVNADGFGFAWYDRDIEDNPGLFRSIQPAWNNNNFRNITRKIKSSCFLAHVRALTVGDVTKNNSHPFCYKNYSFVHNGTINNFQEMRLDIANEIGNSLFNNIKGQTDSEHLFFLIMHFLHHNKKCNLESAVRKAFDWVIKKQEKNSDDIFSLLNIAITDGCQLIVTRFASKNNPALSLYCGKNNECNNKAKNVIIVSEPLNDYLDNWSIVEENTLLSISNNLTMQSVNL